MKDKEKKKLGLCPLPGVLATRDGGMPLKEFTHPEDLKTDDHLYEELLHGKSESYMIDKRLVRKW